MSAGPVVDRERPSRFAARARYPEDAAAARKDVVQLEKLFTRIA